MENHLWKNLLLVATGLTLAACSAPKYRYYFDTYSMESAKLDDIRHTPKGSTSAHAEDNFMFPIQEEILTATTLIKPTVPNNPIPRVSVDSASQKLTVPKKAGFLNKLRVFKNIKADYGTTEGDKKKNGFAVLGNILSIIGLIGAPFTLLYGAGLVLFPAAILGIIFCAIGLKSEKRRLAKSGLIVGLLAVLLFAVFLVIAVQVA